MIKLNQIKNLNKPLIFGKKEQANILRKKNNNHFYHEINSFREREKITNSPIKNTNNNYKKLSINKSTRQINSLKNIYDLNKHLNIKSKRNSSVYFYQINSEKNRGSTVNSNDHYETENNGINGRQHKNCSIHEIVDLRNRNNKKNNINNNSSKYQKNEETKNSNTIYIETSPNIKNNSKNGNIYSHNYKFKIM